MDFLGRHLLRFNRKKNSELKYYFDCLNCPTKIYTLILNIILVVHMSALKSASMKRVVLASRNIQLLRKPSFICEKDLIQSITPTLSEKISELIELNTWLNLMENHMVSLKFSGSRYKNQATWKQPESGHFKNDT